MYLISAHHRSVTMEVGVSSTNARLVDELAALLGVARPGKGVGKDRGCWPDGTGSEQLRRCWPEAAQLPKGDRSPADALGAILRDRRR